ncbi:MAG TPA: prepilin-type N-terminal cleavage/methylation domain-containing protein [Fimbriimonadaceae bacterium]|nr:prepilin-type N-terminal cleavage/methylation domain-containing protein [Fimbriimonadaceae bacterium]
MKRTRKNKGFTLVEIMIVVLIIGILLAIAIPNFVKARETSRAKTCVANLRQIESAKEQACMEGGHGTAWAPGAGDLSPDYIKNMPSCPSGGNYTIGNMSTSPSCSTGGTHTL